MRLFKSKIEHHIDLFLAAKGVNATTTINQYRYTLRLFAEYSDAWPPRPEHITGFLAHQKHNRKLADGTIHSYYRTFRTFSNWLFTNGHIDDNFIEHVDQPVKPEPLPRVPPREHIKGLFDYLRRAVVFESPGRRWLVMRDIALFGLLYDTGMRVSEARRLRFDDLTFVEDDTEIGGNIHVRKSKTKQQRLISFSALSRENLKSYFSVRPGPALPFVFVRQHQGEWSSITSDGILKRLGNWLEKADIPHFNVHAFRHAAAVAMLEGHMPLNRLQMQLGHRNLTTTERYLKVTPDTVNEFYRKAVPLARLLGSQK